MFDDQRVCLKPLKSFLPKWTPRGPQSSRRHSCCMFNICMMYIPWYLNTHTHHKCCFLLPYHEHTHTHNIYCIYIYMWLCIYVYILSPKQTRFLSPFFLGQKSRHLTYRQEQLAGELASLVCQISPGWLVRSGANHELKKPGSLVKHVKN
jgi:hypothetical protein